MLHASDGVGRAALVNVANGNGPPKVLKRSVKHLIPIEANDTNGGKKTTAENDTTSTNDGPGSGGSSLGATNDTTISSTRP